VGTDPDGFVVAGKERCQTVVVEDVEVLVAGNVLLKDPEAV
jgi:hypothetical protein